MNVINIGIGELAVSSAPDILRTLLGSCVGVAIFSPKDRVGGLLHVMLPELKKGDNNTTRYANTGVPELITLIESKYKVKRKDFVAKIAGGANMFQLKKTVSPIFDIGPNNITAVRHCLKIYNIPISGEDVGMNHGRRIEFHIESGMLIITGPDKRTIYR